MSAFNAFFAQLTGGGGDGSSTAAAATAAPDPRGTPAVGGGGSGGGEIFGVPLAGAAITYDPESDRSRFGNPQVRFRVWRRRGGGDGGDACQRWGVL